MSEPGLAYLLTPGERAYSCKQYSKVMHSYLESIHCWVLFMVHSYRREYVQALYLYHAPGRTLPPATGRLKANDYDRDAAYEVTLALGHNRIDVVLCHYLR
jgi:hypothetical protein